MSGPELPYSAAYIRLITNLLLDLKEIKHRRKIADDLRELNLGLKKPTSRKIFTSSDLATDLSSGLDSGVAIAPGLRGPSNRDPHISRLQTQTRFFTPLSCNLEPDITKHTLRKIFASSDLATDLSSGLDSGWQSLQAYVDLPIVTLTYHAFEHRRGSSHLSVVILNLTYLHLGRFLHHLISSQIR